MRLAIVGAGPAGIYAADLMIKAERDFEVSIDLFDLLPAPCKDELNIAVYEFKESFNSVAASFTRSSLKSAG